MESTLGRLSIKQFFSIRLLAFRRLCPAITSYRLKITSSTIFESDPRFLHARRFDSLKQVNHVKQGKAPSL